jgi:hypothetical protein
MVMALFRGRHGPNPQYSAVSVREAKHTRLGYRTRLSRLHTLDHPFSITIPWSSHSATPDPEQRNNQGNPDKVTGISSRPACDKIPHLKLVVRQGKAADHVMVKKCKNIHKTEA